MNTVLGNCRLRAVLCRRKYFPQAIVVLVVVIGAVTAIAISGCTTPTPEVVVEATIEPEDTAPTYEAEVVVETEGAVVEVPIEPPGTPVGYVVDEKTEKMAICQDNESYGSWPEKTEFDPDDDVCIVWCGANYGGSNLEIKVYPSGSNEPIVTPTLRAVASSHSMWNMATPGIVLCPGAYETQFASDKNRLGTSMAWSISRPAITRCTDVGAVGVTPVTTFSVGQQFQSLALSPDGKTLAVGYADGSITLWRAETGQRVGDSLKGHSEEVVDLAFSPDGEMLASASLDNTIGLWDVNEDGSIGESPEHLEHEDQVLSVAFHPYGKELASIDASGQVIQWDVTEREMTNWTQPAQVTHGERWCIAYTRSGNTLLRSRSSERTIDFYPDSGGSISHSFYHVTSTTFRPDEKMFASGDSCGYIHLWDFTSVAAPLLCQLELGSAKPVVSLSFNFNNQWLAAGNAKGDVFLWKIAWP
jgi:WD40 repeat protein